MRYTQDHLLCNPFEGSDYSIRRQLISSDNSYQATTHMMRQLISSDNSYHATTHIKRQLITGDNSNQFEKATTHIKLQLISIKTHFKKSKST